ncbi:MAG: hypothetical protein ABH803_01915 [Candidatus Micrarchaeota archaeon]
MKKLFSLLLVSLLLFGCTDFLNPEPSVTPWPTPEFTPTPSNATPTPIPTATLEVTPTPSATLAPETALSCGNTAEGDCVSNQPPLYCQAGFKTENCGKCGCSTGQVCGRIDIRSTFKCWDEQFIIDNNGTILTVTDPTPTPNATVTPSPTPTPHPTIAPLPDTPNLSVMTNQLQTAVKQVVGKTLYFQGTTAKDTYQLLDVNLPYLNFYLYDGVYSGWTPLEQEKVKQLNETLRYNFVLIMNDTDKYGYDEYRFKMECFNWNYSIDVLTRNSESDFNYKYGYNLAMVVASYCR